MAAQSLSDRRSTAEETLAKYTDPAGYYAFSTYDRLWHEDQDKLTPSDVLMANLLSLRLGWQDVIPLFAEGDGPAQQLRTALDEALFVLRDQKPFESYESVEALEHAVRSLAVANEASGEVKGWTAVTVSKVLHRRRPHIVPLIDSRVRRFYGVTNAAKIRAALWHDLRENSAWLVPLAESRTTPDGRPLTLLRLADILIWTP